MSYPWLRPLPEGVELTIRVQPRASRTQLQGEHAGMLKISLAAPPVEGEANAALVAFVAGWLGVPRRQVDLAAGHASRRKRVVVKGVDVSHVEAVMTVRA